MHFVAAFIAILAAAPAFTAPVPPPQSVDSLVASAHGDPTVLIQQLKPITEQIRALVTSMTPNDTTSTPNVGTANPSYTPTPIPVLNEVHQVSDIPPAAQPGADEAIIHAAAVDPTQDTPELAASPAPTESPNDPVANDSGRVQRRDADTDPETNASTETATATSAAPASPAPGSKSTNNSVKASDVRRLRDLLAQAKMIEGAIEAVFLASGQNIDEIPSERTAGGMAWGIANGPILAIAKMFNFSKQN